jgi:hypothetical protein
MDAVCFGHRQDRPGGLTVAVGRWRRRLLLVPVARSWTSPGSGSITLSHDPTAAATAAPSARQAPLRSLARRLHQRHAGTT